MSGDPGHGRESSADGVDYARQLDDVLAELRRYRRGVLRATGVVALFFVLTVCLALVARTRTAGALTTSTEVVNTMGKQRWHAAELGWRRKFRVCAPPSAASMDRLSSSESEMMQELVTAQSTIVQQGNRAARLREVASLTEGHVNFLLQEPGTCSADYLQEVSRRTDQLIAAYDAQVDTEVAAYKEQIEHFQLTATINALLTIFGLTVLILLAIVPSRRRFAGAIEPLNKVAQQLQRMADKLRARSLEVEALRGEVDAAGNAKDAFLAMMSHEIRTPMNGIVATADLLSREPMPAEATRLVHLIQRSGESLLTVINDVLDFSKIQSGQMAREVISFDLESLVHDQVATMQGFASQRRVELHSFVAPELPALVGGDLAKIRQILSNLITNAIKFSAGQRYQVGMVLVTVDCGEMTDQTVPVTIHVRDNGIGMSQEQQQQLFRPFTQLDTSTSRRFGGTGLGLSIVSRLVELLGGTIRVQSTQGAGSVFSVALPLATVDTSPAIPPECRLDGAAVAIVSIRDTLLDYASRYVAHAGGVPVNCDSIPRLRSALNAPAGPPVNHVIIDSELPNHDQIFEWLRDRSPSDPKGMATVALRVLSGEEPRREDNGVVACPSNPLRQSTLLYALAIADGRINGSAPAKAHAEALPASRRSLLTQDQAEAAGSLVLLAEDNKINQEVIVRQLASLGYTAIVADDGQNAYEIWSRRRIALLLTDLHMPRVDGFTLTTMIRSAEAGASRRTPIIAITAATISGEREACIDTGMDGFVSKPVAIGALKQLMEKWLPGDTEDEPPPMGDSPPRQPAPGNDTAAPPVVDVAAARAAIGDDPVFHRQLCESYLKQLESTIDELRAALTLKPPDPNTIKQVAHGSKSAAASVAAIRLRDLLEQIEHAADAGDMDRIGPLVGQLPEAKDQLKDWIRTQS